NVTDTFENNVASTPRLSISVVSQLMSLLAMSVSAAPLTILPLNTYGMLSDTKESKGYVPMFWLPSSPQDTRNLKSFIHDLSDDQKFSSDTRHPAEKEGNKPHLFPLANRDEPS